MADRTTLLASALADAATCSWIALGGNLEGRPVEDVVDIEALIAATARLGGRVDARTREVAADWCARYGWAVSRTRLARVAVEMRAEEATAGLVARPATGREVRATSDRMDVTDLDARARLAWRLRAAFGTVSRADVLLALMLSEVPLAVSEIARRTRYTKGAVAAAIGGLELAGLVQVVRIGREDRVALAPDGIVAAWTRGAGTQPFDMVARWHVGIEVLETLESTAGLGHPEAAIARRTCVEGLLGEIVDGGLPWPNTKVRGPVFAVQVEFWAAELAEALRHGPTVYVHNRRVKDVDR